jgi:hypothetical protein
MDMNSEKDMQREFYAKNIAFQGETTAREVAGVYPRLKSNWEGNFETEALSLADPLCMAV